MVYKGNYFLQHQMPRTNMFSQGEVGTCTGFTSALMFNTNQATCTVHYILSQKRCLLVQLQRQLVLKRYVKQSP